MILFMEIHRRMRRVPPLLLSAFLSTAAPGLQEHAVSYAQTEERVVGLLEIPEILGDIECKDFQPRRINFYGTPSKDRPSTGTIEVRAYRMPEEPNCYFGKVVVRRSAAGSSDEELPSEEIGYEMKAAVVYERNGPWFRIALAKGSAWIERAGTIDFLSYPSGLASDEYLTYLRQDWDGRIWPAAGAAASVEAPRGWQVHRARSLPIQVLSTRTINREIWIQIRFETEERCGQTLEGVTPLEGWIPAYRQNATSVWFSSRGC
jgi:hypothetical protein